NEPERTNRARKFFVVHSVGGQIRRAKRLPLLVDTDQKLMIALGFSDRVGRTLCDFSGKMTQINKDNFKRTIRVCYPAGTGTLVIRTQLDWGRDVNPVAMSSDGNTATFEIEAQQRFVHFKPCLIKNGSMHWAGGPDNLLLMTGEEARPVYPYFFSD